MCIFFMTCDILEGFFSTLLFSRLWFGGSITLCTEKIPFTHLTSLVMSQICVMHLMNVIRSNEMTGLSRRLRPVIMTILRQPFTSSAVNRASSGSVLFVETFRKEKKKNPILGYCIVMKIILKTKYNFIFLFYPEVTPIRLQIMFCHFLMLKTPAKLD